MMQATDLENGINTVCFQSDGGKLEGLLYIPTDYKVGKKELVWLLQDLRQV